MSCPGQSPFLNFIRNVKFLEQLLQLTSCAVNQFITAMKQFNFETTLTILVQILAISFPLSMFIQKGFLDLETASTVQKYIQGSREHCDIEFEKLFSYVKFVIEKFDIPISLTRQNKRSHNHNSSIKYLFLFHLWVIFRFN